MKKLIYILTLAIFASCMQPQQKLRNEITAGEKALFADSTMMPDQTKASEMVKLYIAYADRYPDDSSAAEYLFKAGDLVNNLHQPAQAIQLFGRVQHYNTFSKVPVALFLQGFIAETEMHDLGKAKLYYESFLQKYPDHKLAGDVQSSLNNLGKSPEELIREFEAKQKQQDSTAVQ